MCYRDTGVSPEHCFVASDVSWPWLLLPCYLCCHHQGGLCYTCLLLVWAPPGSLAVLCTVLKWCCCRTRAVLQPLRALCLSCCAMGLSVGPPPSWCSSRATWIHRLQAFSLLCASPWLGSRGLHLGSAPGCSYLWKLSNCARKKAGRGCLANRSSAGSNLQSTCVCSGVQRRCAAMETCLCMPRERVRACEQKY